MDGDDAEDFLLKFWNKFDCDLSEKSRFDFRRYFGPEGFRLHPLWWPLQLLAFPLVFLIFGGVFFGWLFGWRLHAPRKPEHAGQEPLTVGMLYEAAREHAWPERFALGQAKPATSKGDASPPGALTEADRLLWGRFSAVVAGATGQPAERLTYGACLNRELRLSLGDAKVLVERLAAAFDCDLSGLALETYFGPQGTRAPRNRLDRMAIAGLNRILSPFGRFIDKNLEPELLPLGALFEAARRGRWMACVYEPIER